MLWMVEAEKEAGSRQREQQGPREPMCRTARGQHSQDVGAPSGCGIGARWGLAAFSRLEAAFALAAPRGWSVPDSEGSANLAAQSLGDELKSVGTLMSAFNQLSTISPCSLPRKADTRGLALKLYPEFDVLGMKR